MATKLIFANPESQSLPWSTNTATMHLLTPLLILIADILSLMLVSGITVLGRHLVTPSYELVSYGEVLPFFVMLLPVFLFQGLYPGLLIHPAEEMRRIFYSISIVFLIWASFTFLLRNSGSYSRSVYLITWAAGSPVVLLSRYLTRRYFGRRPWWGIPAVVLGSGEVADRVVRKLRNGMLGVKVVAAFSEQEIIAWDQKRADPSSIETATTCEALRSCNAQYAIVAMPHKSNRELSSAIVDYCLGFSHVLLMPDMTGVCSLGISAKDVDGELGLELPQRLFHRSAASGKRALDLIVSGSLLLLLSPLLALITIAIRVSSPGPVFFGHSRYGRNGSVFKAIKFRSMVRDAETVLANYLSANPEQLFEWKLNQKLKDDPRVTRVGKLLRRYSLDELPQLINVLVGNMSLVGPRPIVSREIQKYGRGYELYGRVRPGITGLWQVSGRNNTTYLERVAFDEYYVNNWSLWLDIYILIRTVKVVLTAEGAY